MRAVKTQTGSRRRWFRATEHIPRDAFRHKGSVTRKTSVGLPASHYIA
jgi:hypothetical protein